MTWSVARVTGFPAFRVRFVRSFKNTNVIRDRPGELHRGPRGEVGHVATLKTRANGARRPPAPSGDYTARAGANTRAARVAGVKSPQVTGRKEQSLTGRAAV